MSTYGPAASELQVLYGAYQSLLDDSLYRSDIGVAPPVCNSTAKAALQTCHVFSVAIA